MAPIASALRVLLQLSGQVIIMSEVGSHLFTVDNIYSGYIWPDLIADTDTSSHIYLFNTGIPFFFLFQPSLTLPHMRGFHIR